MLVCTFFLYFFLICLDSYVVSFDKVIIPCDYFICLYECVFTLFDILFSMRHFVQKHKYIEAFRCFKKERKEKNPNKTYCCCCCCYEWNEWYINDLMKLCISSSIFLIFFFFFYAFAFCCVANLTRWKVSLVLAKICC